MSTFTYPPPRMHENAKEAAEHLLSDDSIAQWEDVAHVLGRFDDFAHDLPLGPKRLIARVCGNGDGPTLMILLDRARIEGQKSQHKVMKQALTMVDEKYEELQNRLGAGVRAMAKLATPGDEGDGIIPEGMADCFADGVTAALAALIEELRWAHHGVAVQIADQMIRQQAAGLDPADPDWNGERPAPYGPLHSTTE